MSTVEHDPLNDLFVAQVRVFMKQNDISVAEVQERMGLNSAGYIYQVFNGETSPTLDWIARITRAVGMDVDLSLSRSRSV